MAKPQFRAAITGTREQKEIFAKLDDGIRKKATKKAVDAGSKVMLKTLKEKARASKMSGLLLKSLGKKSKAYRRNGVHVGIIGARSGFRFEVEYEVKDKPGKKGRVIRRYKRVQDPRKYMHLVERKKPFNLPAFVSCQAEARRVTSETMGQEIDLIAKQVARK